MTVYTVTTYNSAQDEIALRMYRHRDIFTLGAQEALQASARRQARARRAACAPHLRGGYRPLAVSADEVTRVARALSEFARTAEAGALTWKFGRETIVLTVKQGKGTSNDQKSQ